MNNIKNIVRSLGSVVLKHHSIIINTPTLRILNNPQVHHIHAYHSRNLSSNTVLLKYVDGTKDTSNLTKKTEERRGYSIDDDNLIAMYIEMYGNNSSTYKSLSK